MMISDGLKNNHGSAIKKYISQIFQQRKMAYNMQAQQERLPARYRERKGHHLWALCDRQELLDILGHITNNHT
jgi:hypothetical protein